MTPAELAALHARCFKVPRPFTRAEFTTLLATPTVFLCTDEAGFALGRAAAGEAELLTVAVDPDRRRQGHGRRLLATFAAEARRRGAESAFLEVAADNTAARALYSADGYRDVGTRRGYYRAPDGAAVDAILMHRPLGRA